MSKQTVFVLFRYCPLCRLNHKKGKKHVYSRRHKEIVAKILAKFLKKITEAKEFLKNPSVKEITWDEAGNKSWCYFCQGEVNKHRLSVSMSGQCVVQNGGFLEHITRSDHAENTAKFLKENMLDMKKTSEYIINEKVYLKFLEDVEAAAEQFFMLKYQVLTQITSQIKSQSMIRRDVVINSFREQSLQQQNTQQQQQSYTLTTESRRPKPVKGPDGSEEKGKKTVQAFGEGLTAIERPDEDDRAGNIYTNAVPPWMQPSQDTTPSTCVVGPTLEDLDKHKKLERKRLLPACRVGAKFDHKSGESAMWLPDFGGVWNHGRRTKSVHQFIKRQKRGSSQTSSSPLFGGSDHGSDSLPQTSYSFPKMPKRTATVTSGSDLLTNSDYNHCIDKINVDPTNTNHIHSVDKMNTVAVVTNCSSDFPFNVPQNADFSFRQDSEMSPLTSCTTSAGARSLTGNTFYQVPDLVDADYSVKVKPYVRKNRISSSTVLEQNQPTLPYIPPAYCHVGPGTLNTINSMPRAHTYSSFNSNIPVGNHLFSGHGEHWHNNSSVHQRPAQSSQFSVCAGKPDLQAMSFRLLATPVLSQQKSKLQSKTIFGAGGCDK